MSGIRIMGRTGRDMLITLRSAEGEATSGTFTKGHEHHVSPACEQCGAGTIVLYVVPAGLGSHAHGLGASCTRCGVARLWIRGPFVDDSQYPLPAPLSAVPDVDALAPTPPVTRSAP